eukprot:TRINITY_DN11414_c0_g1_i1.p1 TRINITY_DN11414_c0_g1~~TRINITY_DN11414_c0_g1_i1.p1  ORF type:complete len:117 (-),score=0.95 TRINITY_DN11414_c0_g1_i1:346-696(-)
MVWQILSTIFEILTPFRSAKVLDEEGCSNCYAFSERYRAPELFFATESYTTKVVRHNYVHFYLSFTNQNQGHVRHWMRIVGDVDGKSIISWVFKKSAVQYDHDPRYSINYRFGFHE